MKYTAEAVTKYHVDKIADQISDAVVDAHLEQDKYARVAVETAIGHGQVYLVGEVTSKADVNYTAVVHSVLRGLNYNLNKVTVLVNITKQSPNIAQGVDGGGAGDQGCIKEGSLVKTDCGFERIEKVKKGTNVTTPFGFKRVLNTKFTGIKDVLEIIFKNGMRLACTPDHKILCYTRDGNLIWKFADKLSKKDFVCINKPSGFNNRSYYKSIVNKSTFFTKYNHKVNGNETLILNEDIAYIIGLLVGDGCVVGDKWMDISFGRDLIFANKVLRIVNRYFDKQWKLRQTKNGMISLKVDSILVRKHFYNFGLGYDKANNKTTPEKIFNSPISVISKYLRGLFDSDGTIVSNTGRIKKNIRIRLSSSSYRLLQEIQLLLVEFGIKSSLIFNIPKGRKVGRQPQYVSNFDNYVINLVGFESYQIFGKQIGFLQPKKAIRMKQYLDMIRKKPRNSRGIYLIPHPRKKEFISEDRIKRNLPYSITQIKTIKNHGKARVYDLEIQDNHIFSANGIFVHNCMIGYACRENDQYLPNELVIARQLLEPFETDGKSQISIENGNVTDVVLSVQGKTQKELEKHLRRHKLLKNSRLYCNNTGSFEIGGFDADSGCTGRKLVVDAYGPRVPVGGGAWSGKDPTKVDRSGAYMARYMALDLLKEYDMDEVIVKLGYVIGGKEPLMKEAALITEGVVLMTSDIVSLDKYDCHPEAIIEQFGLRKPIYLDLARNGHFGRKELAWEK